MFGTPTSRTRRAPIGLAAVFIGVWLAACMDGSAITAVHTRPGSDVHRLVAGLPTCMVRDTMFTSFGYHGWLEPNQISDCGVTAVVSAIPDTGRDFYAVWWYRASLHPDSAWVMSGGDGVQAPAMLNGGEAPLHLQFSEGVTNVRVLWQFNPLPGSLVQAFDQAGALLGQATFGSNTVPSPLGTGATEEEHLLTLPGIRRLKISAGPGVPQYYGTSKMWVKVWFDRDTTCPPTGDSTLASPGVRDSLIAVLNRSNPNAPPGTGAKLERGGIVWQLPTGGFLLTEISDPPFASATECHYSLSAAGIAPPVPGAYGVAVFHTHPHSTNEEVFACTSAPGQPKFKQYVGGPGVSAYAMPDENGGGSDADWASTNNGFPSYVINKDGRLYRLDPGTPAATRKSNPNKWEWKSSSPAGCLQRL